MLQCGSFKVTSRLWELFIQKPSEQVAIEQGEWLIVAEHEPFSSGVAGRVEKSSTGVSRGSFASDFLTGGYTSLGLR